MTPFKLLPTMKYQDWLAEGKRRFGDHGADLGAFRFKCPACGHVASVNDWKAAGAAEGEVAFSCIGRRLGAVRDVFADGPGPCNYAGGGLFRLNPQPVEDMGGRVHNLFAFADVDVEGASDG